MNEWTSLFFEIILIFCLQNAVKKSKPGKGILFLPFTCPLFLAHYNSPYFHPGGRRPKWSPPVMDPLPVRSTSFAPF
jgi:hypothetical protein